MISSNKLVEACLCVYDHPAWITDSLGTVIAKNDAADHLNIEEEVFEWSQLIKRDCNHYIVRGNIYENPDLLS